MNRDGGPRRKSRHKFTKANRTQGKISITNYMQSFDEGQKVHLTVEPAVHKGMYHSRFIGKTGVVSASRGKCYEVKFNDKGKDKMVVVHPVHLKPTKH